MSILRILPFPCFQLDVVVVPHHLSKQVMCCACVLLLPTPLHKPHVAESFPASFVNEQMNTDISNILIDGQVESLFGVPFGVVILQYGPYILHPGLCVH